MKEIVQYCGKCGRRLVIVGNDMAKINYWNTDTGQPVYKFKVKMRCPNKRWFNFHGSAEYKYYPLTNEWERVETYY